MKVLLGLGALLLAGALFVLGVDVLVWGINDIVANGANFWNVFWIVLVGCLFVGAVSR